MAALTEWAHIMNLHSQNREQAILYSGIQLLRLQHSKGRFNWHINNTRPEAMKKIRSLNAINVECWLNSWGFSLQAKWQQ